jgi:hypothetical protein
LQVSKKWVSSCAESMLPAWGQAPLPSKKRYLESVGKLRAARRAGPRVAASGPRGRGRERYAGGRRAGRGPLTQAAFRWSLTLPLPRTLAGFRS